MLSGLLFLKIAFTHSTGSVSQLSVAINFGAEGLKPRPNDRNMPTQHIATLLGATCCVRLATLLRHVATCWVLLAQV